MKSMIRIDGFRKAIAEKLEERTGRLAERLFDVLTGEEASCVDEVVRPWTMMDSLLFFGEWGFSPER